MNDELRTEMEARELRVRAFMEEHGLECLWLRRVSSFAWATVGATSYVNTAVDVGEAELLFTPHGKFVVTNNIEAPRLEREEELVRYGFELAIRPWHEPSERVRQMVGTARCGCDTAQPGTIDIGASLSRTRSRLSRYEVNVFRDLSARCADALTGLLPVLRRGMTEYQVAAQVSAELLARTVLPIVVQVAADERAFAFRHPLPTSKRIDRYVLVSICGRMRGLVCSLSRAVHFGAVPEELAARQRSVAGIDAALLTATKPSTALKDVFAAGTAAYASNGHPNGWMHHHQGGPAGYEPREYLATPTASDLVSANQVYAWNPTVPGAKSEDTVLVNDAGYEVLTRTAAWPILEIAAGDGTRMERPAILQLF